LTKENSVNPHNLNSHACECQPQKAETRKAAAMNWKRAEHPMTEKLSAIRRARAAARRRPSSRAAQMTARRTLNQAGRKVESQVCEAAEMLYGLGRGTFDIPLACDFGLSLPSTV
jgi:hypothetical protein